MEDIDYPSDPTALKTRLASVKHEAAVHYAEMVQWRQQYELVGALLATVSNTRLWRFARHLRTLRRFFWRKPIDVDALIPWQHLEPAPASPHTWRTTGEAPFFLIPCLQDPGWIQIDLRLTSSTPGHTRLFVDCQGNFRSLASFDLEATGGVADKRVVAYLPGPIRSVRLDPLNAVGEFRIEKLRVNRVPRTIAFLRKVRDKLTLFHSARGLGRGMRVAFSLLFRGQWKALAEKVSRDLNGSSDYYSSTEALYSYDVWCRQHQLTDADRVRMRQEAAGLKNPPLISVLLPVYNIADRYLRLAIESVLRQIYPHWELCIADDRSSHPHVRRTLEEYARRDPRIKVVYRMQNGNISAASNSALAVAQGEYTALLDHDDELAEHALLRMAQAIVADRKVDMFYSDEDKLELDGRHVDPFFKPEWSPEYFLACMYTCHLGVYRTELLREIGGFRSEFDSAQDYDLVLRLVARGASIRHVPEVLYHWRKVPTSTATGRTAKPLASEVARNALRSYLRDIGREGTVEPGPTSVDFSRVRFKLMGRPKVSIIIGSACRPVFLHNENTYYARCCIASIQEKSTYDNIEIILISNNDIPPDLAAWLAERQVKTILHKVPFNWSGVQNLGAAAATGDYLLFLNDDMEVITPDWLESMLEFAQVPEIGAVGARLFYPDGRLQHAGVCLLDGNPTHAFHQYPGYHPGYFFNNVLHRNVSAVTGACLLTRRDVFEEIGGFDVTFPLEFNDVDYCLKVVSSGKRIVYMPYAELYHYESATRKTTVTLALIRFRNRWGGKWKCDPYHNPNLSTHAVDYRIDLGEAA